MLYLMYKVHSIYSDIEHLSFIQLMQKINLVRASCEYEHMCVVCRVMAWCRVCLRRRVATANLWQTLLLPSYVRRQIRPTDRHFDLCNHNNNNSGGISSSSSGSTHHPPPSFHDSFAAAGSSRRQFMNVLNVIW